MRILLLSAYDAASHRRWRRGLVEHFPEHDWHVLTLPARHFSWRIRGNSLTWAFTERDALERGYDLVVATSMVDLSPLKGLVPALAGVPSIAYFHENQFAYPGSERQFDSVDPQMVTLYTALTADRIAFNSDFNRRTFLAGVEALLAKFPDAVPEGIVDLIADKSTVLPVPLDKACFIGRREPAPDSGPLHVIWNHRWEYDKGPDRLLAIVERLLEQDINFELSVIGQQFRQQPREFDALKDALDAHPRRLRRWGTIDATDDYRRYLATGDVALSTAVHEFQGLAVLEAVAAGCVPLVPDRLAYPDAFADEFRYPSIPDDIGREADGVVAALAGLARAKSTGSLISPPAAQDLSWSAMTDRYARLLASAAGVS
jgi:glycosyltransferase involved in cell wall biosynthesis